MDTTVILYAVAALGALGLVFGAIAALAAGKLRDTGAEDREPLLELLPGVNCGACGYAGCRQMAEALILGEAMPGDCKVGGAETTLRLADVLGIQLTPNARLTAMVYCSGGIRAKKKFDYVGLADCHAAMRVGGDGPNECGYGCMGMGSCVAACKFGALSVRDGVAVVDHDRCTGCGDCVAVCPKHLIKMIPYTADVVVACSSRDRSADLQRICEIGCVACSTCQRTCKHDAIHVTDNLAVIDYDKCTGCGDCAERCPRKLIVDAKLESGWRPDGQVMKDSAM